MTLVYSRTVTGESPEGHPTLSENFALHEFEPGFALIKTLYLDGEMEEETCIFWLSKTQGARSDAIERAVAVVVNARKAVGQ
jgi:hypothetical protein